MKTFSKYFMITWILLLVRYRRTKLGPLWLVLGPAIFIAAIGGLYAEIGTNSPTAFIPYLAFGLVVWNLVSGVIISSSTLYVRSRGYILNGGQSLFGIVTIDIMTNVLVFFHQVVIIIVVMIIYPVSFTLYSLLSIVGLMLIVLNGFWVTRFMAVIGSRYRDVSEITQSVLRIAFLATPIIWMPEQGLRGGLMGAYLVFNPFYHFIEIVRSPLLGQPVSGLTWLIVGCITLFGFLFSHFFCRHFERSVPLWV